MRLTKPKKDRGEFGIVVTSMLDINFLLIMFFMLTAQFQRTTYAPIELPKEHGEQNAEVDEAGLVINLAASGEIIISQRSVGLDELRVMVQEQVEKSTGGADSKDALKLMIRADRNAGSQNLNEVIRLLREEGVGTIRIATEVPAGSRS